MRNPLADDAEVLEVVRRQLGVLDPARVVILIDPPRAHRVPHVQVDVTLRYRTSQPTLAIPNLAGGAPIVLIRPISLQANSTLNVE